MKFHSFQILKAIFIFTLYSVASSGYPGRIWLLIWI